MQRSICSPLLSSECHLSLGRKRAVHPIFNFVLDFDWVLCFALSLLANFLSLSVCLLACSFDLVFSFCSLAYRLRLSLCLRICLLDFKRVQRAVFSIHLLPVFFSLFASFCVLLIACQAIFLVASFQSSFSPSLLSSLLFQRSALSCPYSLWSSLSLFASPPFLSTEFVCLFVCLFACSLSLSFSPSFFPVS